jgi:hypothetical protein
MDALPGPHYGSPVLPQALVDWSQLISAVLSLVALVVALAAIVKSNRDIVRERRTTHELDVLLGIAESLKTFGGPSLPQLMRTYLLMLPGDVDFPVARAEFDVRATDDGRRRHALMKQDAPPSPVARYQATQTFLDCYRSELEAAITRRLTGRS